MTKRRPWRRERSTPPSDGASSAPETGRRARRKRTEDLYRLLVETVQDYAIFTMDTTGHITSWNAGAQRIKGFSADDIIGHHFSEFYPEEDVVAGKPERELEIAIAEGRVEDEGWRVRKDGTQFWANVVITALRDPSGQLIGFAKVTRDLTERREAEQRAIATARRLAEVEAASRAKSEFLAVMSHELRTPLNAIAGYAELLSLGLRGPVTEEQQRDLKRIRRSQQHLLAIINDILNYSRLDAGRVTYQSEAVSLLSVIDEIAPLVEPQATARALTLFRTPCDANAVARADRPKVEQILLNLLSNAVKFTPAGGRITISCANDEDQVAIIVSDTGPGIPPEQREAIFEPFVQLGRSLTTSHEGTGLGLAISRDLARAMGGDLTVASADGNGAAFTLSLPRS